MDVQELARWLELAEARGVASAVQAAIDRGERGLAVHVLGNARVIEGGRGSQLYRVFGFGFDGEADPAVLDRIEAMFEAAGQPARIELCPYADPSWLPLLRARGWGIEGWREVFVRALDEVPSLSAPGVVVREVDRADAADVDLAARVIDRGFAEGAEPEPDKVVATKRMIGQPQARAFLATVDGVPAGGGTVVAGEGRVVLLGASTLPEQRRRGVQSSLIAARLAAGREGGARLAVIQAAPGVGTRRNAERLGFRLAYTRATLIRGG